MTMTSPPADTGETPVPTVPEQGVAGETGGAGDAGVALSTRLDALTTLVELGSGRLEQRLIDEAKALLDRTGERMRLSGEHTVVTLAGGTGSGKSSLFNAICGLDLSPTGLRRPMTSKAHACVWGLDGARPLLDWLDVDKRFRYARASALDSTDSSLQGLVLLDLPDHDSIQAVHRAEADRFVSVADLLVWVVDPQKYADASLHRNYIVPYARHAGVTLIVLNQIDRLQPEEVDDCVSDLRRLLEAEGLHNPRILTSSTITEDGVAGFREVLVDSVAARRARVERLAVDIDRAIERFVAYRPDEAPQRTIEAARAEALVGALTEAAGAPAVAEAMESAYELRAVDYVGWPIGRIAARLRSDPLRKMRLTELREELRGAFTGPVGAQQGDVDNALQGVTDGVTTGLPGAWERAVRAAGRSRAEELPEALGASLREALPAFNQVPRWWWLVKTWQYFLVIVSGVGLLWIAALLVYGVAGLGGAPSDLMDDSGLIPYVAILLACTLGMGALTSAAFRNVVGLNTARLGERIEGHMRQRIAVVTREKILDPVAAELAVCTRFREAFPPQAGESARQAG